MERHKGKSHAAPRDLHQAPGLRHGDEPADRAARVISFDRLTVREYPKIDTPVVSVRTVYKGASAQVVESQVTQPLEDSLSGIEGIKTHQVVSREEVSQITVEFVTERDVGCRRQRRARPRVARARRLPEAATSRS
jgi:multidrug efflux pump